MFIDRLAKTAWPNYVRDTTESRLTLTMEGALESKATNLEAASILYNDGSLNYDEKGNKLVRIHLYIWTVHATITCSYIFKNMKSLEMTAVKAAFFIYVMSCLQQLPHMLTVFTKK